MTDGRTGLGKIINDPFNKTGRLDVSGGCCCHPPPPEPRGTAGSRELKQKGSVCRLRPLADNKMCDKFI